MDNYFIGIDLGGTTVKMGLFDTNGCIISKWSIPTNKEEQGSRILPEINTAIHSKLSNLNIDKSRIKGIGIGVPGPVTGNGEVSVCVNLGWKDINVVNELQQLTDIPVKVGNDANVAALGEMWQGSGKGYRNLAMITLGTGIGGGVVIDGRMVSGLYGAAGEFGHMPLVPDITERCGCGRIGCLEQVASATGIVKEAKKQIECNHNNIMSTLSLEDSKSLNAREVIEAAKAHDPITEPIVERACHYLGIAMANITGVIDPDIFIIGGGLSGAGEYLRNMIQKHYKENVLYVSRNTEIRVASLGNDAGIYGAAYLAMTEIYHQ